MAKPRKHVFHRFDRVTIVEPLVVHRVGYPLGVADGLKHVEAYAADINALLVKMGIISPPSARDLWLDTSPTIWDNGVARALAYSWLRAKRFGGPERTIHTILIEGLRGATCEVMGKRVVYTGKRVPGRSGWGPEDDSDPPYLSQSKAHVLLEVCPVQWDLRRLNNHEEMEVEECNVLPYAEASLSVTEQQETALS